MNCMLRNHCFLWPNNSRIGLQMGLITQGKYKKEVYNPISALEMPRFLYITTDTVMMMT
jgi:hypothetical protein